MTRHWTLLLTIAAAFVPLAAQDAPQAERLLTRRYVQGDRVQYLMKAQDGGSTYEVRIRQDQLQGGDEVVGALRNPR
jgi:hypothetical protein